MLLNQRLGLVMIIASLLVMGSTVYIMVDSQRDAREEMARSQGLGLARLLGSMSWTVLVPPNTEKGFLQALYRGQSNPDFAYGAVVDLDGKIVNEVTASAVLIPVSSIPREPSAWLGQRVLPANDNRSTFIESHAPVFENNDHKGYVRLGYREPRLSFGYHQMPLMATVALPIFLLTPLFYFMLRQDIKPLQEINNNIEKLVNSGGFQQIELQPGARLGDFMDRFNQFIEGTQAKIQSLSEDQNNLLLSSKLLSYKNNRVDAILQNMPDAILVIDEAGEVSYVNDRVPLLLGLRRDDILGNNIRQWCQNSELLRLLIGSGVASNMGAVNNTLLYQLADKPDKSIYVSTYPLFSPMDESKVLGRLVVLRDATENVQIQQRQSEFVSHIAHELKTPLNVLAMYSESLLDLGLKDETYRIEAANVIHDEVERLSTLINNLLAINQYELGGVLINREHVRIYELLEDAFNTVTKSHRGGELEFKLDIPREMSAVFIDKDLMRIAINNLLTNAIKYSKDKGKVSLSAVETENDINITVSDEGYGISEQDQKNIFDKFFRSTDENIRQQTGHGLGLSLAQQIIQMHHAELSLKSELNKGTEFTIRLEKFKPQLAGSASG